MHMWDESAPLNDIMIRAQTCTAPDVILQQLATELLIKLYNVV